LSEQSHSPFSSLVLRKAVVPNFEKAFAERTEAIQGGIEKAEKAQQEAQAALEQYNSQLASARDEAARLREEARAQAANIADEIRAIGSRRSLTHCRNRTCIDRSRAPTSNYLST